MTDVHDPHTPTPDFRAALRSQLRRSYRADLRFDEPARGGYGRHVGMVVGIAAGGVFTLAVGLVLGASTGYASAAIDRNTHRDSTSSPRSALSILTSVPMKSALAMTCSAVANAPAEQQGVPVVSVSPVLAKTSTTLGAVLGVRELPGGRLLVNDAGRRQIKTFDSTFANVSITLDSTPGSSNSYFATPSNIARYLGDSTLFSNNREQALLVLDNMGRVARAVALPPIQGSEYAFERQFPVPRVADNIGRLLAEGGTRIRGGEVADSTLVLRADLDTRQVEIVGAKRGSGSKLRNDPPENGYRIVTSIIQPVPTDDSWSVLSDGTIAFVRARDYHIDWIHPDGSKSSTEKLPFDWKRLTDADKQHLIDSARVVWDSLMAIRNTRVNTPARGEEGGGDPSAGRGRSGGGAPLPGQQGSIQRMEFPPLNEIPDFYPPIHRNASIADMDGNLWILPTTSAQSKQGELVYDVVNPRQGLFQRVRMPVGRSIAGFGKGGIVYLQAGDRTNGFYLERVKVEAPRR